jgi:hypothetical protein
MVQMPSLLELYQILLSYSVSNCAKNHSGGAGLIRNLQYSDALLIRVISDIKFNIGEVR